MTRHLLAIHLGDTMLNWKYTYQAATESLEGTVDGTLSGPSPIVAGQRTWTPTHDEMYHLAAIMGE